MKYLNEYTKKQFRSKIIEMLINEIWHLTDVYINEDESLEIFKNISRWAKEQNLPLRAVVEILFELSLELQYSLWTFEHFSVSHGELVLMPNSTTSMNILECGGLYSRFGEESYPEIKEWQWYCSLRITESFRTWLTEIFDRMYHIKNYDTGERLFLEYFKKVII